RSLATLGMTSISPDDVARVRARIARAHELAAIQFRETFVLGQTPPTAHLQMLADALIGESEGIRLIGPAYDIHDGLIEPKYESFVVERTPVAIFEYWLIVSEITGSDSWRMTRLITGADEYDAALKQMRSPQIVRALVPSFLPSVEDSMLSVVVYSRAGEERIERRQLFLDDRNEFHFHGRELIAEGR
ncbi:MAG TPA: hypothetical protein VI258_06010, partial [Rhodanobacteraceae bacterium]